MFTRRARSLLVVLLALVVVGACSPSATTSPSPADSTTASDDGATGAGRSILIDTDVAPDDLVAIAFLLASPDVKIQAITVSGTGEAHCGPGVDVVLRLLERLEAPPIDVACGRETPIAGDRTFPDAWRASVDGGSGLALPSTSRQPFDGDAVQLMSETADRVDGLRILTLGPLTNLAEALSSRTTLAPRLESVYVMGGAMFVPGNVAFGGPQDNEVAEWNVYVDPTALQVVIDAGLTVRLVGLDGTNQVPVTPAYAERVQAEAAGPGALVLAELFEARPFMTDGSYFLWDPLAAALAADYPVGTFSAARVEVEEAEGDEVGFTRPVEGTPNVEYLSAADAAAAEDTLLQTLNGSSRPAQAPSPSASPMEVGTTRIDDPNRTSAPFTVTVPARWTVSAGGTISKHADEPNELGFSPEIPTHVYTDACKSEGTLVEVGPTVDDLVRALADQVGSEASAPVDVMLGGFPAKRVDVSVPTDLDVETCRHAGELIQIWADPEETSYFAIPAKSVGLARQVYIADIDGERVVIVAGGTPSTSAADLAELDAIVDSISFEP